MELMGCSAGVVRGAWCVMIVLKCADTGDLADASSELAARRSSESRQMSERSALLLQVSCAAVLCCAVLNTAHASIYCAGLALNSCVVCFVTHQVESLNDQLVATARKVEDREADLNRLVRDKDGLQVRVLPITVSPSACARQCA